MAADVCAEQDEERIRSVFPVSSLPPEIHLHILQHLPRCDIDNCRFVCKRWKEMIDYNIHLLRKHLVDVLELRECKSRFVLNLKSCNISKSWTFNNCTTSRILGKRKLTKTSDIFNNGNGQQDYDFEQQQQPASKLPHLLIYNMEQTVSPSSYLPVLVPNIIHQNIPQTEDYGERKQREHTPSQLLCERLAKCFHEADIEFLRLTDMRFTDCFVDRLTDAFNGKKICCKKLEIIMCKLNYISPEKFHQFLQMIKCESLSLMWLRGNNGHISNSRNFLSRFLDLGFLSIRAVTPQIVIGDDQFLIDFLKDKARKYPRETVLQLDYSSITTSGFFHAIDKWRETNTHWIVNLCVVSEVLSLSNLLRYLSLNQSKPQEGAFRIPHPRLPNEALLLWHDKDGLHIASNKKQFLDQKL
ncbi:unnamed protein product [Thelazia callipaeda]|uniref:F-box domain-containing protein n=1 Tax=Thelazia callipaeda TaxID=103827 RepID=A0A0N5DC54_THECL|nr:unnamed protein product [Thelazia callipaeda]